MATARFVDDKIAKGLEGSQSYRYRASIDKMRLCTCR